MIKSSVVVVLLLGSVAVANAATQCYQAEEIEADQAVRFQAKLMVLSDSCNSTSYNQFTAHNGDLLSSYQKELIGYYRRTSAAHAEAAFDQFITRLANQDALSVGEQPLSSVCGDSASFLAQGGSFGKEDFRKYVAEQAVEQRKTYPSCKG
jgi:hypothetical protein